MKKNLIFISLGVTLLTVFSCMDKDVYDPGKEKNENDELDLTFNFALKSEKAVTLTATDAFGSPQAGVQFNIYLENPCTEEGISHDAVPAYTGYTGKDGALSASISLPHGIKQLYVYPATAGFGEMRTTEVMDNISLHFQSVPFPVASTTRAAGTRAFDASQIVPKRIAKRYNIFSPYLAGAADANGVLIPGGSPLVSKETLDNGFLNQINSWYPELSFQSEELLKSSSDIIVTDDNGAEVWVTYISDGGFCINNPFVYTSVLYYNYEPGDLTSVSDVYKGEPANGSFNTTGLRMTLLFPNIHSRLCPAGLRVQLLYWDQSEEAYSSVFPKGTHIGFVTARSSYKKEFKAIDDADAYWFAQPVSAASPNSHCPTYELFYSTPCLNGKGLNMTNAITRVCSDYNCIVVGMDVRYWDDVKSDRDFNDALFKVVANPPEGIVPENGIDPDPVLPFDAQYGTLAFEDLWPSRGDYDFNDFVVDYTYNRIKPSAAGITELRLSFRPLARGASKAIGFGIELPFPAGMVKNVEGATLESGNDNATLIVWNNTDEAFQGRGGILNTRKGSPRVEPIPANVKVTLSTPLSDAEVKFLKFNPFIFVEGNRGHEVHLVDYAPTFKVDNSLFGTLDDRSDAGKRIFYRMDNTYPWALDIPRTSSSASSWRYPAESENITETYLNYEKWVKDKTDNGWFDSSVPGNVDSDKLY